MKCMQGYDVLWFLGMDYVGIVIQVKVEVKFCEEGKFCYDFGCEKFFEEMWKWKEEYVDFICSQWVKLGFGFDYFCECFILDEGLSKVVCEVFVKFYEKGLIYRGEYIINWDFVIKIVLFDIEVIYKDVQGVFYYMSYLFVDGLGLIEIVMICFEMMFGDIVVVVYFEDECYKYFIGKMVILLIVNCEILIVGDDYVDMEFGLGVVKIMFVYDLNDFEFGNCYNLECIFVMNEDGIMNENVL